MVQEPKHRRLPYPEGPARWLVVVLLAGLAGALLVELGRTASAAGGGVGEAVEAGRGLIAVPAQFSRDVYGLYLVDGEKGRMCVYQYLPASRKLRLLASRNFTYDLGLDDYNTQPSPMEVKEWNPQQGPTGEPASEPVEER